MLWKRFEGFSFTEVGPSEHFDELINQSYKMKSRQSLTRMRNTVENMVSPLNSVEI